MPYYTNPSYEGNEPTLCVVLSYKKWQICMLCVTEWDPNVPFYSLLDTWSGRLENLVTQNKDSKLGEGVTASIYCRAINHIKFLKSKSSSKFLKSKSSSKFFGKLKSTEKSETKGLIGKGCSFKIFAVEKKSVDFLLWL